MARRTVRRRRRIVQFLEIILHTLCIMNVFLSESQLSHFVPRNQIRFGIPVTVKTPTHAERLLLPYNNKLVNPPMTTETADTRIDMNIVAKSDKIRKFMDANPFQRDFLVGCLGIIGQTNRQQFLALGLDLTMAVHARLNGGDICVGTRFNPGMAITAVNAQVSGMQLVAVGNRLFRSIALVGVLRGEIIPDNANPENRPTALQEQYDQR